MSRPLSLRMARINLEKDILTKISQSSSGLAVGELRKAFEGQPVTHAVEHLTDREQLYRYEGGIYSITNKGRSRLSPPVCVTS